jgi:Kae1-associated kinase Bud32
MRLSGEEREALIHIAEESVNGKRITSICAYGSKVAGYAKPDSDYDLIIAVKKFPAKIRYRYMEDSLNASALIVDDRLLEEDALKASLGEFVAGRFLNIYEPMMNDEFLEHIETAYKKRVIAEALLELTSEYGEFAQDLIIPLEYFLFDKLHKRATVYPPALYSYVRTYTCKFGLENKEFTLKGFREAATSLASEGVISIDERSVRIVGDKLKGGALTRAYSILNLTTRGVWQYAVHGYAGRVGLGVFKKEALSKLKRMREKVEPSSELQNPKKLLRLDEGVVFDEGAKIVEELAKIGGFKEYVYDEKNLGQLYSTTKVIAIKGFDSESFVIKHFADIRSIKWALLNIWSLARKFSTSPLSRLHREYSASRFLRERGINTPRIIGVAIRDKVLVREYINGEPLSEVIKEVLKGKSSDVKSVSDFGRVIAKVHRLGFALGDAKASNVIVKGEEIYLADLEQAIENGDMAWDIAEFLYYTAKLSWKEEGMRRIAEEFLRAYSEENGTEIITRARSSKYLTPFRPFLTNQMARTIKEALAKYSD